MTFTSVGQRDHPEYRGKLLIVGLPSNQRGVVCAISDEGRKFKVRSALHSRTAGKLCPHGIFVRPRMDVYRAVWAFIMEIRRSFTPVIQCRMDSSRDGRALWMIRWRRNLLSRTYGAAVGWEIIGRNRLPAGCQIRPQPLPA